MLTVTAKNPFELLRNILSLDIWFRWRSLVRGDPTSLNHFASTCLLSIDYLEYLHLFDAFLLFRFGLVCCASSATISWLSSSKLSSTTLLMSWLLSMKERHIRLNSQACC